MEEQIKKSVFTYVASIYPNLLEQKKAFYKKIVQLPRDLFGNPTWPPWRHVKTLYTLSPVSHQIHDIEKYLLDHKLKCNPIWNIFQCIKTNVKNAKTQIPYKILLTISLTQNKYVEKVFHREIFFDNVYHLTILSVVGVLVAPRKLDKCVYILHWRKISIKSFFIKPMKRG